jgi:hypothetical protein
MSYREGGFNTTIQAVPEVPNTTELSRGIKPKLTYSQAYWNYVNAGTLQESWEALDQMKELVTLDQTYSSESGSWMPDSSNPLVPKPKGWTVQNASLPPDTHRAELERSPGKGFVAMGMFFGAFAMMIIFSILFSTGILH